MYRKVSDLSIGLLSIILLALPMGVILWAGSNG